MYYNTLLPLLEHTRTIYKTSYHLVLIFHLFRIAKKRRPTTSSGKLFPKVPLLPLSGLRAPLGCWVETAPTYETAEIFHPPLSGTTKPLYISFVGGGDDMDMKSLFPALFVKITFWQLMPSSEISTDWAANGKQHSISGIHKLAEKQRMDQHGLRVSYSWLLWVEWNLNQMMPNGCCISIQANSWRKLTIQLKNMLDKHFNHTMKIIPMSTFTDCNFAASYDGWILLQTELLKLNRRHPWHAVHHTSSKLEGFCFDKHRITFVSLSSPISWWIHKQIVRHWRI